MVIVLLEGRLNVLPLATESTPPSIKTLPFAVNVPVIEGLLPTLTAPVLLMVSVVDELVPVESVAPLEVVPIFTVAVPVLLWPTVSAPVPVSATLDPLPCTLSVAEVLAPPPIAKARLPRLRLAP